MCVDLQERKVADKKWIHQAMNLKVGVHQALKMKADPSCYAPWTPLGPATCIHKYGGTSLPKGEDVRNGEQCHGHLAFSSIWRPTISEQLSRRSCSNAQDAYTIAVMHYPGT